MMGFVLIGVILVNGCFAFWQDYRAEKAVAALRKLLPKQVRVLRENRITQVEISTFNWP